MYCKKELSREQWVSEWGAHDEQHYKGIRCACGKKNWFRLKVSGSGHDRILHTDVSALESAIRKVHEK